MRQRTCINSGIALFLLFTMVALGSLACGTPNSNGSINANSTVTPAPTPPDPCSAVTDQMIADMIYGELIKDPDILAQIKQINVTVTAGAVTLYGWVSDKTISAKVVTIANNGKCTKPPANVDNFYDHSGNPTQPAPGCVPPLVRCGDRAVTGKEECDDKVRNE